MSARTSRQHRSVVEHIETRLRDVDETSTEAAGLELALMMVRSHRPFDASTGAECNPHRWLSWPCPTYQLAARAVDFDLVPVSS